MREVNVLNNIFFTVIAILEDTTYSKNIPNKVSDLTHTWKEANGMHRLTLKWKPPSDGKDKHITIGLTAKDSIFTTSLHDIHLFRPVLLMFNNVEI